MGTERKYRRSSVGCRLSAAFTWASLSETRIDQRLVARRRRRQPPRRGVLLLVVLSMLVLFMLIGTAFLMSSSSSRDAAKISAKLHRVGNYGTELLDRAVYQVIRDTENPNSAVRYHSLLRDLYGADGFEAVVYSPESVSNNPVGQPTRFAGATSAAPLGPTAGQFIDIYVRALAFNENDPLTPNINEAQVLAAPDARHVLKLEKNILGQRDVHTLPLTSGYYNGCLLTITSGPAAGQSARIVDYQFIGNIDPANPPLQTRLFRLRVMAFPRRDGTPLEIDASRSPEIADLAGATFTVNGRAYNGTGVGYNPLAAVGTPRLNALQVFDFGGTQLGAEIALTPNSAFLDFGAIGMLDPTSIPDPFPAAGAAAAAFLPLNDSNISNVPIAVRPKLWPYQTFAGPGDADESYDAADFQNIYLALMSVTPRSLARLFYEDDLYLQPDQQEAYAPSNVDRFLRYELEDVPLPSFHRPDLVNFWYHRMLNSEWLTSAISDAHDRARCIIRPYLPNGNPRPPLTPELAAQITAIKRKIMMRPLPEDHLSFDGSNTRSRNEWLDEGRGQRRLVRDINIAVPYWELCGPWDVDNDNDGVADSIWVDLGDTVTQAEDGTLYKPLYAFLILDMDSRLNVNAHGLADHIYPINPPPLDPTGGTPGNLANDVANPTDLASSNLLPHGIGYGPAEISLRPIFPTPWLNASGAPAPPNRAEDTDSNGQRNNADLPIDSYAALLVGRYRLGNDHVAGKHGLDWFPGNDFATAPSGMPYEAAPGITNAVPGMAFGAADVHAQIALFGYPLALGQYMAGPNFHPTSFGTPPDLMGRYSLGLDYTGQPVHEYVNEMVDRPIVPDSPYELNLSTDQRYDTRADGQLIRAAMGQNQYVELVGSNENVTRNVGGYLVDTDDAPFATADLERILRATDSDAGTLPSRLWDVVDAFDPVKLATYDPFRIANLATQAFGTSNTTTRLAAAQQVAAINRHLVTTDSSSLPVPGMNMPGDVHELGRDGAPGVAGTDDDPDGPGPLTAVGGPDDASEIGAPGSDDFEALTGTPYADAGLIDLLRYRIQAERIRALGAPFDLTDVSAGGGREQFEILVNQVAQQILAPELIAGLRMDLNRPFGDGRDNGDGMNNNPADDPVIDEYQEPGDTLLNGVVDEPLEAGEPFLDVNGNGKRDDGTVAPLEPFIDLDGNGQYAPPRDQLWTDLSNGATLLSNGATLAEPIAFDHTNGHAEPVHPAVATALGTPVLGGVRNLDSQSRQLYARHLYCLMLMLVDQNYIAPWDDKDPQINKYLDINVAGSTAKAINDQLVAGGMAAAQAQQEAQRIMLRKLTCRTIAQWAVNCADMQDADIIMTPFEYDENPWDGWGCPDNASSPTNIPLDGDPATDEDKAEVINWAAIDRNTGGGKTIITLPDPPTPLNQTRGVVWGAERPELLITETLAFHDRRTEDLAHRDTNNPRTHDVLNPSGKANRQPDDDLDQSLRPRGSLFVEVYNPWSADGQRPAELYSKVERTGGYMQQPSQGVELGRLSNFGSRELDPANPATSDSRLSALASRRGIKRSPVWRIIVVEDWPEARNTDKFDDMAPHKNGKTTTSAYSAMQAELQAWTPGMPMPYRAPDPDFDAVFDRNFIPKQQGAASPRNLFDVEYPYIEREFYFTADNLPATRQPGGGRPERDFTSQDFALRIPERSIRLNLPPRFPTVRLQNFLALEDRTLPENQQRDVPIAPILPGRYGVIGSAGTKYTIAGQGHTTTIGRRRTGGAGGNTADQEHRNFLDETRRIELHPNPDPNVQQLLVLDNGGDPQDAWPNTATPAQPRNYHTLSINRDNELIDSGSVQNITDPENNKSPDNTDLNNDRIPEAGFYQPCVAIPVDGMNISEPPWGYGPREREAADAEAAATGATTVRAFNPDRAFGEGRYADSPVDFVNTQSYDEPFDKHTFELYRTGTTANYRTIHLQRLANPTLPWNPAPKLANGDANPSHDPTLPVNPYLTIDSSSADVTAFNGVSNREGAYQRPHESEQNNRGQYRPWLYSGALAEFSGYTQNMNDAATGSDEKQVFHFRSLERGAWALLNAINPATPGAGAPAPLPAMRVLWAQEPARITLRDPTKKWPTPTNIFDFIDGRQVTRRAEEVPAALATSGLAGGHETHQVDMVLEHSLGFGNEAFGLLYDRQAPAPPAQRPPNAAFGGPKPYPLLDANGNQVRDAAGRPIEVDSTYPWLTWNNRPFVSAEELLQVPAASSAQMLAAGRYSTINPNVAPAAATNPYASDGLNNAAAGGGNPAVSFAAGMPFGHLLSFFAVETQRSSGGRGNLPAPHFYRLLEYVRVPSRYVGTDTVLTPEVFNDVPGQDDSLNSSGVAMFGDITGPQDPRYKFQPPFNKVSRQRDPGRVNLNTVIGRRVPGTTTTPPQIWSEVYDGIMHRFRDSDQNTNQYGHFGPAWRDVTLSRRGYAQNDATGASVDKPGVMPDTFTFGLNNNFPTFFANPFRSPDAGDLVPLAQMSRYGVDASWLRSHHYSRGADAHWGTDVDDPSTSFDDRDDDDRRAPNDPRKLLENVREAGFGDDVLIADPATGQLTDGVLGNTTPLFSETVDTTAIDPDRNPYMMYQPMTRMDNLMTTRSGVFAIWVTVGYFEVEPAPDFDDVQDRFLAATNNDTVAARALYDRVYPDGYMLAKEVGHETGNVRRHRGFYIVDRTQPVGFKPGEDLNVENTIRLKRRIE